MESRLSEGIYIFISIVVASFILNFVWESLHAVFLFEDHKFAADKYMLMVINVSLFDVLAVLSMSVFIAVIKRNAFWIEDAALREFLIFFISGIIIAIVVEHIAVNVRHAWSYNPLMPTIFGIGLSPLLQLSCTGTITLLIAKHLIYARFLTP